MHDRRLARKSQNLSRSSSSQTGDGINRFRRLRGEIGKLRRSAFGQSNSASLGEVRERNPPHLFYRSWSVRHQKRPLTEDLQLPYRRIDHASRLLTYGDERKSRCRTKPGMRQ